MVSSVYVLKFEPAKRGALYRGTIWIDRATFARVRVQTVQSGCPLGCLEREHSTTCRWPGRRSPGVSCSPDVGTQILLVAGRKRARGETRDVQ